MLDVIDIGALPEPSYAFLWLTILGPILLFALIVTIVNKNSEKFKSDETPGTIMFLSFFALAMFAAIGSTLISKGVSERYEDSKIAAVEKLGYHNVIPVNEEYNADLIATDKDGKTHLFDYIQLPGDHVGILEVKGNK